jgi:sugar phosphate isomerase/epimerase
VKFALFSGSAPDWTPLELAARLKAQGWDGVEWRVVDQKPAAEPGFWAGNRATFPLTGLSDMAADVAAATQGAGLEHAGIAGYASVADHAAVDALLAATARLGAGRVRVTVPKVPLGSSYNDIFAQTRADLFVLSAKARRHGVQSLIQIHHGNVISTASAALRMLDGIDPETVGVIHDLGNLTVEGREGLGTYTPGMEMLGAYLAHVHVKNVVWVPGPAQPDGTIDWSWAWAPLATGLGDVKSYFRSLREVGYDGWVTVENFTTDLPLEARIAGDLAYLHAAAREAGYAAGPTR